MPVIEINRQQGKARHLHLSCGASAESGGVVVRQYTWTELCAKLKTPTRTPETADQYAVMPAKDRGRVKDVGYFIAGRSSDGRRTAMSIREAEMLCLDADHAPRDWAAQLEKSLPDIEWVAFTTHSHRPGAPRVRLILPCLRAVDASEHGFLVRRIAAQVGADWFDPSGFRMTQPMFWPSSPSDGEYVFEQHKGEWLDPDALLTESPAWKDRATWPGAEREGVQALRHAERAEDPRTKTGLVGAFCRVYTVPEAIQEFIPEAYQLGDSGRYTYAYGSTVNGAVLYGDGRWLYSHHGSDPAGGRLCNAFDLVRIHRFGERDEHAKPDTPATKTPSFMAMLELAREDGRVRIELHKEKHSEAFRDFEAAGHSMDWLALLRVSDKGRPLATFLNCVTILENDPVLEGSVSANLLTGAQDLVRDLCERLPAGKEWDKAADAYVREYLEKTHNIEFPPQMIRDALEAVALKKPFHPIRIYLEKLEWDGVARAETLFVEYLGAEDSLYTRSVCRKMLLAAVTRVFHPGAKFDFVTILEGLQGVRKSTFWRSLSKDWFAELSTFESKAAAEIIIGCWFIEIAELEGFTKYESEQLKAFFSKTRDRFREAYERRAQNHARQCVFVGSTNNDEYLQDRTGNRRYWPIRCNRTQTQPIDTEGLEKVVDMVWAEVMTWYRKGGEKLYLDVEELRVVAEKEQAARLAVDAWEGQIEAFLVGKDKTCIAEIWEECLYGERAKIDKRQSNRIGAALRATGWERGPAHRFEKYGVQKCFLKPTPF